MDLLAAARLQVLLDAGDSVLLAGEGPDGVAVLRFRLSIWTPGLEASVNWACLLHNHTMAHRADER